MFVPTFWRRRFRIPKYRDYLLRMGSWQCDDIKLNLLSYFWRCVPRAASFVGQFLLRAVTATTWSLVAAHESGWIKKVTLFPESLPRRFPRDRLRQISNVSEWNWKWEWRFLLTIFKRSSQKRIIDVKPSAFRGKPTLLEILRNEYICAGWPKERLFEAHITVSKRWAPALSVCNRGGRLQKRWTFIFQFWAFHALQADIVRFTKSRNVLALKRRQLHLLFYAYRVHALFFYLFHNKFCVEVGVIPLEKRGSCVR